MADSAQDRNLPASDRKIRRAREDGQVPRSRDLGHLGALGGGLALMLAAGPMAFGWLQELLASGLRFDRALVASPAGMLERLSELGLKMMLLVVPLGLLMGLIAAAASMAGGGWNFSRKAFIPNFSRINLLSGLGRMFSKEHLIDVLKACALAVIVGIAGGLYLRAHMVELSQTLAMPLPAAAAQAATVIGSGLLVLVGVLAASAVIDVPVQRRLWLSRLKMTREEVKQEMKETEGNVEVKGKMKAKMREMARSRMLKAVPTADLVVMNPTHFAVALKYDDATMAAPRVVAKGADLLAFRIRELAEEAKVPVLRAPPLARALYAHCEVDAEIPARLFAAVAQVLAFVYGLRAAAKPVPHMAEPPGIDVPADLDPKAGG
jgi:flagellar biosynthesis protein FlhB